MIDDNCVDGGGVNGHIVKTRTGMLQTANDVQISQDNISVRSLFSHLGSHLNNGRYQFRNPSIGEDIRCMHKGDDRCRDAG